MLRCLVLQRKVDHAGLKHREAVRRIEFDDAVHPRHHAEHATEYRQRATGQAGARTAWDDRHLVPLRDTYDGRDLLRGGRENDGVGAVPIDRRVVLVGQ